MIWKRKVALILLSGVAILANAQSSTDASLPVVATLIQQTVQQQRFAESQEQEYVFREDVNTNKLSKECTWGSACKPPFGGRKVSPWTEYRVLKYTEHHFEIFWLDGIRVARILPNEKSNQYGSTGMGEWTRDIPTSAIELGIENQRVDSEVAEARALRAQGKEMSSPDDPPQILLSRFLELCTFSNPRRQIIERRSTILLDFASNAAHGPVSSNETLIKFLSGTVGIDEEDHEIEHLEGSFAADVNSDGGAIRIRRGTWVKIQNKRVAPGVWLLLHLRAWGEARYFGFELDGDGNLSAGAYRKFSSTSRVLPGATEVPPSTNK